MGLGMGTQCWALLLWGTSVLHFTPLATNICIRRIHNDNRSITIWIRNSENWEESFLCWSFIQEKRKEEVYTWCTNVFFHHVETVRLSALWWHLCSPLGVPAQTQDTGLGIRMHCRPLYSNSKFTFHVSLLHRYFPVSQMSSLWVTFLWMYRALLPGWWT